MMPAHEKKYTGKNLFVHEYETPEILMDEELRLAAKKPIERMLEISKQQGFD